jgi:RNA polymerase sigma factor (sigma-70 family)
VNDDDDDDAGPVPSLVTSALDGDADSWNRLVERYTPVVLSVVRRFRLQGSDGDDVVQIVWLRLVERLNSIREPEALPGWLVTTTRRECLHVIKASRQTSPADLTNQAATVGAADTALDSDLLEAERHAALLAALAELPDRQRNLLLLLLEDPPLSYDEISSRLHMPVGSIGPTRARALARIRSNHAMQALLDA